MTQQVAAYIERQHQNFAQRAASLSQNQKMLMRHFFPQPTLDSTRVVFLAGERVSNPPFYSELMRMGFQPGSLPDFAPMAAITFVDTVVSHEPFTDRLLFHELVHVVQYEKLGVSGFAYKYVTGFLYYGSYETIPLERSAYELDARFGAAPARGFSVEAEVKAWIDAGRY